MNIPIEILKNQLIRIPWIRSRQKDRHRTGVNNREGGIREVLSFYRNHIASFEGKDVVEFGPGQTHEIGAKLLDSGARSISLIDVESYLEGDMVRDLGMRYILYDGKHVPMDNESVDIIVSYTVYEHIRYPKLQVEETFRLLRPGGLAIHRIDLGDHFSYGVNEDLLFNCLRYPKWLWEAMTFNRSAYINRVRYSEWIDLHKGAGFEILSVAKDESEHIRSLYSKGQLEYLSKLNGEDRFASAIDLVLKKPL